ncbi:MAG: HU family DNA-binding protein [bacterium]|nr:HU family DNA-binding protein [bacterium]
MTKENLVESIVKKTGCSKKDAMDSINTVIDEIIASLSKGKEVAIAGLGKFVVSPRKARTGRNPKTGEKINIPAMKVPRFKAAKNLKEAVR